MNDLPQTVIGCLRAAVETAPDKAALIGPGARYTYAELWDAARRTAGGLARDGFEHGDRVLVMLGQTTEFVPLWFGLLMGGHVQVPLNTALRGGTLAHQINDSGARVMVVDAEYVERVVDIADEVPRLDVLYVRGDCGVAIPARFEVRDHADLDAGDPAPPVQARPSDVIALMYTSGTTGPSKGVLNTNAQAVDFASPVFWGAARADDVALVTLPLFHVGGMWMGVLNSIQAVATAAVPGRFSASRFWAEVREFGATYALLVGAIGNILIRQPASPRDRDHTLRTVYIAPVLDEVLEFQERFGVEVCTGFGMTEANGVLGAGVGRARPKSCGWLRPGYQARIVDDQDHDVPEGEAGELVVRSDEPWRFARGYHNLPEATNELFRNQWLHTGDVFRRTPDGEYLFVDRKKDAIRRRGENVSSFEVEAEANRFPGVLESAAIGVPSDLGEEDICLVVVPRDEEFDPGALVRHLSGRMPYFMVPRYVVTAPDGLPRSATDKVQKARLRAEVDLTTSWDKEQHDTQPIR